MSQPIEQSIRQTNNQQWQRGHAKNMIEGEEQEEIEHDYESNQEAV